MSETKPCQFCGSPLLPNAKSCDACGQPVPGPDSPAPEVPKSYTAPPQPPGPPVAQIPNAPTVEPPPPPAPEPSPRVPYQAPPPSKDRTRSPIRLLVILVIIFTIVCCCILGVAIALNPYWEFNLGAIFPNIAILFPLMPSLF